MVGHRPHLPHCLNGDDSNSLRLLPDDRLRCDRPFIDLEGESGIQLSIELLGQRHMIEIVYYFDLEIDYRPFP